MFKLAKSISPDTLLFLNDYGIIMDRCLLWSVNIPFGKLPFVLRNGRFALFQQQIRDLLAQGAPIDALGQIHDGRIRYICLLCQKLFMWPCFSLPTPLFRIAVAHQGVRIGWCCQVSPLISTCHSLCIINNDIRQNGIKCGVGSQRKFSIIFWYTYPALNQDKEERWDALGGVQIADLGDRVWLER